MIDEIFDRSYQAGRADFHDGIDRGIARLVNGIDATFRVMKAINFASPWAKAARQSRREAGCA